MPKPDENQLTGNEPEENGAGTPAARDEGGQKTPTGNGGLKDTGV